MKMSNGIIFETKSLYNWLILVALYVYSFTFIKYYSYSLYFLSFHFIGNSTLTYPYRAIPQVACYML